MRGRILAGVLVAPFGVAAATLLFADAPSRASASDLVVMSKTSAAPVASEARSLDVRTSTPTSADGESHELAPEAPRCVEPVRARDLAREVLAAESPARSRDLARQLATLADSAALHEVLASCTDTAIATTLAGA